MRRQSIYQFSTSLPSYHNIMQNPLFAFIDTNIGYVSVFLPFLFDVYSTEGLILTSPIADPILNDSMF